MSQPASHAHRPPGRPREFDLDSALDKAVRVFRERGYHATSIGDLSEAMQLAAGSIYKAFKDKRAVFLAAFDRYSTLRSAQVRTAADGGRTGHDRLRRVLASYLEASQGVEGRRGCLVVGSTIELAALDPEVAARVSAALKANEALLAGLIREGQGDGSIPAHVDPDATARLILCMTQGMRVVGKAKTPLPTSALLDVAMKLVA